MRRIRPEAGLWPGRDLPSVVSIDGRLYRRTRLQETHGTRTVAQYRENVPRNSRHLRVYDRGHAYYWRIDHVDHWNPDFGGYYAVRHFFSDHPLARIFLS